MWKKRTKKILIVLVWTDSWIHVYEQSTVHWHRKNLDEKTYQWWIGLLIGLTSDMTFMIVTLLTSTVLKWFVCTANDLGNFNSKKKQSLVAKKIAIPVSEKSACVLFYFTTVVEIIQNIITCKGLRKFSIQSNDQNNKKLNTIKISVIHNFRQNPKNELDKTWITQEWTKDLIKNPYTKT